MPGIDREPVSGGLATHRVEAGAVEQRRSERVAGGSLVEPGEGGGGAGE